MTDPIEELRRDIAATRARMTDTLSELDGRVDHVKGAARRAKELVSPPAQARDNPWLALAIALGVGVAIGMSGADRRAAVAVVQGAKRAGPAVKEGASDAAAELKERLTSDEADDPTPHRGATARVFDDLRDHLDRQLAEVTRSMMEAATAMGPKRA